MELAGVIMDRGLLGGRAFEALIVGEVAGREEDVELAKAVVEGARGREGVVAARLNADIAAGLIGAGARFHIDDAGGAVAVLRRERAGDHLDALGDAGVDQRAKAGKAVGHGDAVEAILDIAVFVADVDRAVAIIVLRDARRLQQHRLHGAVGAAGLDVEGGAVELVIVGADRGLDRIARLVEPRCDGDGRRGVSGGGRRVGGGVVSESGAGQRGTGYGGTGQRDHGQRCGQRDRQEVGAVGGHGCPGDVRGGVCIGSM